MSSTDFIRGRQTATRTLTNRSGGSVARGDVVVIGDGTNDNSFTTTTTAHYRAKTIGVAMETIANAAAGLVALAGYVPIVNSAAGGLTREHFLYTSTVAKEATGSGLMAPGAFGQVLETGADPEAILFGHVQRGEVVLDHVAFTSDVSITATTEATANTIVTATALTFDGATPIQIEFASGGIQLPNVSGGSLTVWLYDGTSIGALGTYLNPAALAATVLGMRVPGGTHPARITPTAAAHTYSIRATVGSGTGTIKAGAGGVGVLYPGFIRIVAV